MNHSTCRSSKKLLTDYVRCCALEAPAGLHRYTGSYHLSSVGDRGRRLNTANGALTACAHVQMPPTGQFRSESYQITQGWLAIRPYPAVCRRLDSGLAVPEPELWHQSRRLTLQNLLLGAALAKYLHPSAARAALLQLPATELNNEYYLVSSHIALT